MITHDDKILIQFTNKRIIIVCLCGEIIVIVIILMLYINVRDTISLICFICRSKCGWQHVSGAEIEAEWAKMVGAESERCKCYRTIKGDFLSRMRSFICNAWRHAKTWSSSLLCLAFSAYRAPDHKEPSLLITRQVTITQYAGDVIVPDAAGSSEKVTIFRYFL